MFFAFFIVIVFIIFFIPSSLAKVGPDTKDFSSWAFSNIYFLDNMTDNLLEPNLNKDVPERLYIMNHVYRSIQIVQQKMLLKINKFTFGDEQMLFSSGALTTPLSALLDRITSNASTTPIILLLFIITIPRAA